MHKQLAMSGMGLILMSQTLLAETLDSSTGKIDSVKTTVSRESAKTSGYFALPVGENITIPATYLEETVGENRGNVLILSENQNDIAGQNGVAELRSQLPEAGWTTMTIALDYSASLATMPTDTTQSDTAINANLASDSATEASSVNAKDSAATQQQSVSNVARIAGAKAYLQARQPGTLVIIAIGRSGELLTNNPDLLLTVTGLVLINATQVKLSIPDDIAILDLFSTRPEAQQQLAKQRQAAMKRQNTSQVYSQRLLDGANRQFQGYETILMTTVRGWLATLPSKEN